jgi:dipeptidyl aminopeptidase/acylaminoacyl peptidase
MFRIESLLSARLFLTPQIVGQRIFFISNLSGRLSLYAMEYGGSVPEPLLPPHLALQNPDLVGGYAYQVFPRLGKILVMLDRDGDENYQPMLIPIEGGFPEPAFGTALENSRVHLTLVFPEQNLVYLNVESRDAPVNTGYRADLAAGTLERLAESKYGATPVAASADHRRVVIADGYTAGDEVLFLWEQGRAEMPVISGVLLEERRPDQEVPLTGINALEFSPAQDGLLALCAVFSDSYGPAFLDPDRSERGFEQVRLEGVRHQGTGEMTGLKYLEGSRYAVTFNIDGCTWLYEAVFDRPALTLRLEHVLVGQQAPLANGKMESYEYAHDTDRFILSFSTATSPTQIYTIEGPGRDKVAAHTRERVLGIDPGLLSPGEDASFVSFDGTRVSARLYLPAPALGYQGPRPLVYYIHGGPQSQERPDFAWFSMPLIQYLTLNGFAVFVPNVRGSSGYGQDYMKQVDRDWGGQDRLDHVHAIQALRADPRINAGRAGVVGRSYGGYMTLTLAARHPELWSGAVDMFGPFDLLTFVERIPETWKPYFHMAIGHPVKEREFLVERSPRTYIDQVACPLLVIQGKNDPRVVEQESRDLVEYLRGQGKQVEYLMFENEGHDVLKFENRVRCYTEITDFFNRCLKP